MSRFNQQQGTPSPIYVPPMQSDIDSQMEVQTRIEMAKIELQKEILKKVLMDDELLQLDAKLAQKKVEIFVNHGFSRQEAITIISGVKK